MPERKRISWTVRRARMDKTLFRLPAPFYRDPRGRVRCPPATERITFVRIVMGEDGLERRRGVVRGYLVLRADDKLSAYYITECVRRADDQYGFDTLNHQMIDAYTEGSQWMRGWDDETFAALSAAAVMA